MRVLELGGGLSGFQFALDKIGCDVVNVDPGLEAKGIGWPCDSVSMERLNRLFGTRVQLRNTTIENAGLGDSSVDRAFSISVIEHLTDADIQNAMKHIYRCLKPGGLFILTIDLFLNLRPFCSRVRNEFGRNHNVCSIAESENWELVEGNREELFGFDAFDPDRILSNLENYLIGQGYPALVQCLILRKGTA
jgi:SAM-dependent methyltransferase